MKSLDERVAQVMNDKHLAIARRINDKRNEFPIYDVGQKIWYLRPEKSGDKLDSRWIGPGRVESRIGEHSYMIRIRPGDPIPAHVSFLKAHKEDKFSGKPIPMYYFQRSTVDQDAQADEFVVDKIINHRLGKDGRMEFLTIWKGYSEKEANWEPINHFFHRYGCDLVKYCKEKRLKPEIIKFLSSEPMED